MILSLKFKWTNSRFLLLHFIPPLSVQGFMAVTLTCPHLPMIWLNKALCSTFLSCAFHLVQCNDSTFTVVSDFFFQAAFGWPHDSRDYMSWNFLPSNSELLGSVHQNVKSLVMSVHADKSDFYWCRFGDQPPLQYNTEFVSI